MGVPEPDDDVVVDILLYSNRIAPLSVGESAVLEEGSRFVDDADTSIALNAVKT
jgi:hypothetical protein